MISRTRALRAVDESVLEIESAVSALATRFAVAVGSDESLRRRRLDTFDGRLEAAGLTLEHQIVASGERLVLRPPGGSSTVSQPVKDPRWPTTADLLPSGPVRDVVAPVIGIRALMVASDERRRIRLLELRNKDEKTVARVELDEPAPGSAAGTLPAQLTVRGLRGYQEQAAEAARLLLGLGLRFVDSSSDQGPSSGPTTPPADRALPARLLLKAALSDNLVVMRENLPGLLDDVDTEFLHDFRVAVRRTRATLKLGRPVLPAVMRLRWEPAFKGLGDLTTPVRDLDVYEQDLPVMSQWLVTPDPADLGPFAAHLRSRRTTARRVLVDSLRSPEFARLVTDWAEELTRLGDTPVDADPDRVSAGELADSSISRAYRRVARDGAVIGADSPAEDLHALRKRCKELRYALEVFSSLIDHSVRKQAVSDLKGLQDVLGRFQDAEVQRHALRRFAEEMMAEGTTAGTVLAMGELIGHLDVEQDKARREFDVAFSRFGRPSSLHLMQRLGGAG